jgi:hypothetical protein
MMFRSMRRSMPIGLIVVGVLFGVANVVALSFGYFFPKILAASPAVVLFGIAMLLVPAAEPPADVDARERQLQYFAQASMLHKVVWVGCAVVGGLGGLWMSFTLNGFFA